MKKLYFLLIAILQVYQSASAEIFVIVNKSNTIQTMTKTEVTGIFMGRYQSFKNGVFALPLDQQSDGQNRASFYTALTGHNISFINAYWTRLLFTGRATPPKGLTDNTSVIELVKTNPNAIGYIDSSISPDALKDVKVVLEL